MPDPDALWKDIQKLDDLYEELLWHPDDELQFNIEYSTVTEESLSQTKPWRKTND